MKIILIDKDLEYTEKFKKYFEQKGNYVKTLQTTKWLTKKDIESYEILVASEDIKSKKIEKLEKVIHLTETEENDLKSIYKYQTLESIEQEIIRKYKCINEDKNKKSREMIAIYSVDEDYDYTNLIFKVIYNMRKSRKIIYIDLKPFSNVEKYVTFEKESPSIINIYYSDDPKQYLIKTKNSNIYTFYPTNNPFEFINLKESNKNSAIEKICGIESDYIVINCESKIDRELVFIFEQASSIIIFNNEKNNKIKNRLDNFVKNFDESVQCKIKKINTSVSDEKIYKDIIKMLIGDSNE